MEFIQTILAKRTAEGLLRKLKPEMTGIDFCSNDYLGLARSAAFHNNVLEALQNSTIKNGATGSRLLSGNSKNYEQLEQQIAQFHHSETALIYPSGYQANIGLLQCIAQKGDTLILDELAHASLIDGARLSHAHRFKFAHNDLTDLRKKLNQAKGEIFVVVEALYSMDGDLADLPKLVEICKEFNAKLIVDEAHSGAVYGPSGSGLVVAHQLQNEVFARIITYGKGFGTHGASVLGSFELIEFLINFSRSFIYSTATAPIHLETLRLAYDCVRESDSERKLLASNIAYFKSKIGTNAAWISSSSAIQGLMTPGNENAKDLCTELQQANITAYPILSPTVSKGKERIRFCLHSFNTHSEIDQLFQVLNRIS